MPRVRFVLAFLFLFSMFAGLVKTAQPVLAAESANLAGLEVSWGNPWSLKSIEESQKRDNIALKSGAGVVVLSARNLDEEIEDQITNMLAVAGQDQTVSALSTIDGDSTSYELGQVSIEGDVHGYFYLTDSDTSDVAQLIVAPLVRFETIFDLAQRVVTLDGTPVFDQVESSGLVDLLGVTADSVESEAPTEESEETRSGLGTSPDRAFISAQFGYIVEWVGPWGKNPSGEGLGEFSLACSSPAAVVGYNGVDTKGTDLILLADAVMDVIEESLPAGSSLLRAVVGQELLFVYQDPSGVYFIQDWTLIPGTSTAVVTTMVTGDGSISVAINSYRASTLVNGQTPFQSWPEIEDAF